MCMVLTPPLAGKIHLASPLSSGLAFCCTAGDSSAVKSAPVSSACTAKC